MKRVKDVYSWTEGNERARTRRLFTAALYNYLLHFKYFSQDARSVMGSLIKTQNNVSRRNHQDECWCKINHNGGNKEVFV